VPEQFVKKWYRWIDTYQESPDDICSLNEAPLVKDSRYLVQPRSIVALIALSMKKGEITAAIE
jgi:hypothetical protein